MSRPILIFFCCLSWLLKLMTSFILVVSQIHSNIQLLEPFCRNMNNQKMIKIITVTKIYLLLYILCNFSSSIIFEEAPKSSSWISKTFFIIFLMLVVQNFLILIAVCEEGTRQNFFCLCANNDINFSLSTMYFILSIHSFGWGHMY